MSLPIDIKVTGPGQTFTRVLEVLKEALEANGAKVVLANFETPLPYRPKDLQGYEIVIRAQHEPWGG